MRFSSCHKSLKLLALATIGVSVLSGSQVALASGMPNELGTEVVNRMPQMDLGAYDVNSADDQDLEFQFILTVEPGTASEVLAQLEAITDDEALVHARILESETYGNVPTVISIKCSIGALPEISRLPHVRRVEDDKVMVMLREENWGTDRTDQLDLPLDGKYESVFTGAGQYVYIIDTGVTINHSEFGNRGIHGKDFVSKDNDASDEQGHGTHCAGSAVGSTIGIARNAYVVGVRVLDHNGSGYTSNVIAGINWAVEDSKTRDGGSVLSLSLGGGYDRGMNEAITAARNAGIIPVVAAGNENQNACAYSPASAEAAITVGSATNKDTRSYFSNWGSCVDLFAPGSFIVSADYKNPNGYKTLSGTSMATPHVAGVVATLLEKHGGKSADPQKIIDELLSDAAVDKLPKDNLGFGTNLSPNLILQLPEGQRRPTSSPSFSPTKAPTYSFFAQCGNKEMDYEAAMFGPQLEYDWPPSGKGFFINTYGCHSGEYVGIDKYEDAIAIIPRGSCSFETKIREAQKWSQVRGVIIVNNEDGTVPIHSDQDSDTSDIRVPSIMVGGEHSNALRTMYQNANKGMNCAFGVVNYNTLPPTPPTPLPTSRPTLSPTPHPVPATPHPTQQPTSPPRFLVDNLMYQFIPAEFGARYPDQALESTVAISSNTVGCTSSGAIPEDMSGKFVLVLRGMCSFYEKVMNAQEAGAVGAIVMNNINDDLFRMGKDPGADMVTIPSIFIGKNSGVTIAGKVRADPSMSAVMGPAVDSAPPPEEDDEDDEGEDEDPEDEDPEDEDPEDEEGEEEEPATKSPTRYPTVAPTGAPSKPPTVSPPPDGIVCPADQTSCGKNPTCTWWGGICIMDRLALTKNKGSKCTGLNRNKCRRRSNRSECEWVKFTNKYACLDKSTASQDKATVVTVVPKGCKKVSYQDAQEACENDNMRLCTYEEMMDMEVDKTCKLHIRYSWSSDECSNGSRSIAFRRNGNRRRCTSRTAKRNYRCCKDVV